MFFFFSIVFLEEGLCCKFEVLYSGMLKEKESGMNHNLFFFPSFSYGLFFLFPEQLFSALGKR